MSSAELSVLDVGHGNCAVVCADTGIVIVDAPLGRTLVEFLVSRSIVRVRLVIVSHSDADHLAGVTTLLLDDRFAVEEIWVNADASKRSDAWEDFRRAVAAARERGPLQVSRNLGAESPRVDLGPTQLQVVAPSLALSLSGPGGCELPEHGGRTLTANSVSAVVRIAHEAVGRALLAGDVDGIGLDSLERDSVDISAELLVFPHHGGRAGSEDMAAFARRLCALVKPRVVVFSIGRGKHATPREEIIQAIEQCLGRVHIACTQLSVKCAADNPFVLRSHRTPVVARGDNENVTCAGSIVQDLATGKVGPTADLHSTFIRAYAATHLCLSGRSTT